MQLNYKEKSLVLAGLQSLMRDKNWKSDINLMDLRETLSDQEAKDHITEAIKELNHESKS